MEIIREGVIPDRELKVTCWFCRAELLAEAEDLIFDFSVPEVKCPCCGHLIMVKSMDIPKGMAIELEKIKRREI